MIAGICLKITRIFSKTCRYLQCATFASINMLVR